MYFCSGQPVHYCSGVDIRIDTAEALYQACRFPDHPEIQAVILDQRSPMTAKMKSKKHRKSTRRDWAEVRVKIMRWCLRVKLAQNWSRFFPRFCSGPMADLSSKNRAKTTFGAPSPGTTEPS